MTSPKRQENLNDSVLKELDYVLEDLKQNLKDVKKLLKAVRKRERKSILIQLFEKVKSINII